jgi:hypothetical protein
VLVNAESQLDITGQLSTVFTIHGDFDNFGLVNADGQLVNQ